MMIKSKITGRDISAEFSALMSGLITNDEFELITLTIKQYESKIFNKRQTICSGNHSI